jgi:hypothetical protein
MPVDMVGWKAQRVLEAVQLPDDLGADLVGIQHAAQRP